MIICDSPNLQDINNGLVILSDQTDSPKSLVYKIRTILANSNT